MDENAARIIADAINNLAAAVEFQARVQAGEYEDDHADTLGAVERDLAGRPVR